MFQKQFHHFRDGKQKHLSFHATMTISARPAGSCYVPRYPRNNNDTSLDDSRFSRFSTREQGGRNSRGRGRGRGRGRKENVVDQNPFEVTEKFGEVVIMDEVSSAISFEAYEDIPVEASGSNIPPPVSSFLDVDLGEGLKENIKRCKYVKPTPIQRHAIPIGIAGRDLMACAQTGSGKTAAFCFPIIFGILKNRPSVLVPSYGGHTAFPLALILSPTRELSCQIHEEAKKFSYQTGVRVVVAYGGAPISLQLRNLGRGVDMLVATPGRLVDMIERGRVSLKNIKYLALDEADRMLDMGFEPQIRKIVQQMDMPPPVSRQTMLFSATFPTEIQKLASDFLSDYIFLSVGRVGSSTGLISQKVDFVDDMDKRNHLMKLLRAQRTGGTHSKNVLTLVFVETKKRADELEHWLSRNGFPTTAIHGDKVQMERERALRAFKTGATPTMVATDVASRGLDIPHVAHVINFDLPKGIDNYVHRIGRTGRAGKSGLATAFFNDKNQPIAKDLIEIMREAHQEIPPWLNEFAERSSSYVVGPRRYGGGKFGGRDFRSETQYSEENYNSNYNYSSHYGDGNKYEGGNCSYSEYNDKKVEYSNTYSKNWPDSYEAPAYADDNPAASSEPFNFDQGSIVATGWD